MDKQALEVRFPLTWMTFAIFREWSKANTLPVTMLMSRLIRSLLRLNVRSHIAVMNSALGVDHAGPVVGGVLFARHLFARSTL